MGFVCASASFLTLQTAKGRTDHVGPSGPCAYSARFRKPGLGERGEARFRNWCLGSLRHFLGGHADAVRNRSESVVIELHPCFGALRTKGNDSVKVTTCEFTLKLHKFGWRLDRNHLLGVCGYGVDNGLAGFDIVTDEILSAGEEDLAAFNDSFDVGRQRTRRSWRRQSSRAVARQQPFPWRMQ